MSFLVPQSSASFYYKQSFPEWIRLSSLPSFPIRIWLGMSAHLGCQDMSGMDAEVLGLLYDRTIPLSVVLGENERGAHLMLMM